MKNAMEENYWRNPYYRMHYYMVREIIPDGDKVKEIMKLFEPLVVDRINNYEEIRNLRMKAYKSSYHLDKPYALNADWKKKHYSVKEAFAEIRKDGGFKTYQEIEEHYWNT